MKLGNRDSNPMRVARSQVTDQDKGNIKDFSISEDVDDGYIPKRISIKMITIKSSALVGFTFRIFAQATRVAVAGVTGFSMVYEKKVTASPVMTFFNDEMPYIDEDALANTYDSVSASGEYRGQLFCQIVTNAGVDVDYDIAVYFTQ